MGKTGKNNLPAKSPGPPSSHLGKQVPEIFRVQRQEVVDEAFPNMAPRPADNSQPADLRNDAGSDPQLASYLQMLPTREELSTIAADIKNSLGSAVLELRRDIQEVGRRLKGVEKDGQRRDEEIIKLQQHQCSTNRHLIDMRRHLEDLDNRGRRSNIRVRGLPETVMPEAIPRALLHIFNELLDRPVDSPIDLVRAHRALRPRSTQDDLPRDVVCCLQSFPLKEDILRRARQKETVAYEGTAIHLFQDLSAITLQQRRALKPLLDCLRDHGIVYRWRFPFCLMASHMGQSAMIRLPEDVPGFCSRLHLPEVTISDWYSDLQPTGPPTVPGPLPPTKSPIRRSRSGEDLGSPRRSRTRGGRPPRYSRNAQLAESESGLQIGESSDNDP